MIDLLILDTILDIGLKVQQETICQEIAGMQLDIRY